MQRAESASLSRALVGSLYHSYIKFNIPTYSWRAPIVENCEELLPVYRAPLRPIELCHSLCAERERVRESVCSCTQSNTKFAMQNIGARAQC